MLTIGSMFGVSHSSDDPSSFKIQNNVVVYDQQRSHFGPATYVLPSICLVGAPGKSLSLIVPVAVSTKQSEVGVGVSYGFNTGSTHAAKKTFEIGIAAVAVWTDIVQFSAQQQQSFANGTALPTGAATDFRTSKQPAFLVGIYLVPLF